MSETPTEIIELIDNSTMDVDITIGDELSKEEIEYKFSTNFGSRIKGITLRRWEDRTPYIMLFSRADGPYSDKMEGNILYYDGEGQGKDQKLTTANKTLIKSNSTNRTIYGFQQKESGIWKYIGVLEVLDYAYVKKRGFMTYEFKLKQTGLDISEVLTLESKEIIKSTKDIPQLKEDSPYDNVKRKRRNAAFSRLIKDIYDYSCAICSKKRFTNAGHPEVEAAHIYPKAKDGADDLRNGLCLCKLHYWAFDNGLISIKDDYTISVSDRITDDENYKEIYVFDNQKINLPDNEEFKPNSIYLKEHRALHEF